MNGEYPTIFLNGQNQHVHQLEWERHHKDIVKRPGIKVLAEKDGPEMTFRSIEEAAEFCGTYTAYIQNCFKGKQKQSKGLTFERVGG